MICAEIKIEYLHLDEDLLSCLQVQTLQETRVDSEIDSYVVRLAAEAHTLKGIFFGLFGNYDIQHPHKLCNLTHAWECHQSFTHRMSIEEGRQLMKYSMTID
jgi:hypothetical protein